MTADEQFQILLERHEAASDKDDFIESTLKNMSSYILGSIVGLKNQGKVTIDCAITNENLEVYDRYMTYLVDPCGIE